MSSLIKFKDLILGQLIHFNQQRGRLACEVCGSQRVFGWDDSETFQLHVHGCWVRDLQEAFEREEKGR